MNNFRKDLSSIFEEELEKMVSEYYLIVFPLTKSKIKINKIELLLSSLDYITFRDKINYYDGVCFVKKINGYCEYHNEVDNTKQLKDIITIPLDKNSYSKMIAHINKLNLN